MGHYKADTPKRHYAYGNSKAIKKIDKGKLAGWKPKASKVVTAQHYVDKSGKKRYKGTKQLRSTETLNLYIRRFMCHCMCHFRKPWFKDNLAVVMLVSVTRNKYGNPLDRKQHSQDEIIFVVIKFIEGCHSCPTQDLPDAFRSRICRSPGGHEAHSPKVSWGTTRCPTSCSHVSTAWLCRSIHLATCTLGWDFQLH